MFVATLHYAAALNQAVRLPRTPDKLASLLMLTQRMRLGADQWTNRSLDIVERIAPPMLESSPENDELIRHHAAMMIKGLSNQIGNQMIAALGQLQNAYSALAMHCFDPGRPAMIKEHAVQLTNRIVNTPPEEMKHTQFNEEFETWRGLYGQVTAYLRLDMNATYKGFRTATAIKKEWLEKQKSFSAKGAKQDGLA